jgi:hypothetical protein
MHLQFNNSNAPADTVGKGLRLQQEERRLRTLVILQNRETARRLRDWFTMDSRFTIISDCASEAEALRILKKGQLNALVMEMSLRKMSSTLSLPETRRLRGVLFIIDPNPRLEQLLRNKKVPFLLKECDREHFEKAAAGLVHSPFSASRLSCRALQRLLSGRYRANPQRLTVRVKGRLVVFDQREVYAVETDGRKTWLHLGLESHRVQESSAELARLLDPRMFVSVSRGTLLNAAHIRQLWFEAGNGCSVVLQNDRTYRLPLSSAAPIKKLVVTLLHSRSSG